MINANPLSANIQKMYAFKFLFSLHFLAGVMIPFFLYWGKITYVQIMLLQTFFIISVFALEVPTGALADRFGRKASIGFGALSTTVAALVYSFMPSFLLFIVGEFFWALGSALTSGADEALLYDTLKKVKKEKSFKEIIGKSESFALAGLLIAGPVGSIIAAKMGLRYSMLLMAIPFFCAMIIALTIKEPPVQKRIEKKDYLRTLSEGVKYFSQHKALKILSFDMILVSVLSFMIVWTYQPLLLSLKAKIIYLGFIFAAMTALQIIIMNHFEKLEKIFGTKLRYLRISAVITAISFIIAGIINSVVAAAVLVILIAGFGLSREVLFRNYMNKHIESKTRATVLSSIFMLQSLAQGIIYILLGYLVTWSLKYTHIILGLLILAVVFFSRVEEAHLVD